MAHPGGDLLHLEDAVWVLTAPTGVPVYDFAFDRYFPCRRPWACPVAVESVARIGAFDDYPARYGELLADGVRLIHTPEQHQLARADFRTV